MIFRVVFSRKVIYLFDLIVTWIFGAILLISAFPHWQNPYYFLGSVYGYKLVDPGIGQITAMALPVVQLGLAFFLLTRTLLNAAHLVTLGLFFCFATVQTTAYLRGLDITCGCFGPGHESTIGPVSLSFIFSLLALSILRNLFIFFTKKELLNP